MGVVEPVSRSSGKPSPRKRKIGSPYVMLGLLPRTGPKVPVDAVPGKPSPASFSRLVLFGRLGYPAGSFQPQRRPDQGERGDQVGTDQQPGQRAAVEAGEDRPGRRGRLG